MRALIKNPDSKKGKIIEVNGTLENLQCLVDGYIEHVYLSDELERKKIVCYANEEAKIYALKPNFWCVSESYGRFDFIAGNAVFLKSDDEGANISLEDDDILCIENYLKEYIMNDREVISICFGVVPPNRF